jgi:hypothetical protein
MTGDEVDDWSRISVIVSVIVTCIEIYLKKSGMDARSPPYT